MEPVSAQRKGTLADPEVYGNVPGHVIPILEREFDDFDTEATKFLAGEQDEETFIKFRLKQGVYGQRQADRQMIRVKLPFGGVTPEQLEVFADIAENYAPLGKGHITTRQNIQYHHVPLPDAAKAIREMSAVGLSSREACGNTVRNVTGDPFAGVCADEPFDVTPYAAAFVRFMVRREVTQAMPRKFKVAFTASEDDRAITRIHDLGFIPKIKDGVRGFSILSGGGTSIMPRVGEPIFDFVEADNGDYLKVSLAVVRIFDRQDFLRVNRARARIKVLVDKIGFEAFRAMVEDELAGDWVGEENFDPAPLMLEDDEQARAPARPEVFATPNGDAREFGRFVESNVRPQRQDGFVTVEVKVRRGDLSPEQFRGLATLLREHCGGNARTSVQQNLVLRWVREESTYAVWRALKELDLGESGAHEITDSVSCPGTDSCKLGITSSMGLNQAVKERLDSMQIDDELTRRIHVKMSGCPNGCGQHHIADIGFTGASIKVGEHTLPAYIPLLSGSYEGGEVRMGQRLKARLPAKRVPDAVERWVRDYESGRNDGELFGAYVDRVGTAHFEAIVKDLTLPVEFGLETMNYFMDWSRSEPFQVVRGEGECAV